MLKQNHFHRKYAQRFDQFSKPFRTATSFPGCGFCLFSTLPNFLDPTGAQRGRSILCDIVEDEGILQFCLLESKNYVHSVIITIFSLKREGRCIWNKLQGVSYTDRWKALQWEAKWINDISDKSNSCIRKYGSRSNTRGICKNELFFSVLQANQRQKSPAV